MYANSDGHSTHETLLNVSSTSDVGPHFNIFRQIITPDRIANITTASFVSVTLAVSAVIADMLGNAAYSLYKESSVTEGLTNFAFIPMVGSAFLMVGACLVFVYSGLIAELIDSNNTWVRGLAWSIVAINFLLNTALGFVFDKWAMHDHQAQLQEECLWSKLFGFLVVLFASASVVAFGAEKFIGLKLFEMYSAIQDWAGEIIGEGSDAHDTGRISDCCAGLYHSMSSAERASDNFPAIVQYSAV